MPLGFYALCEEVFRSVEQGIAYSLSEYASALPGKKTRWFIPRQNWGSLTLEVIGRLADIGAILAQ